jgi:hypothetical protein
MRNDDFTARVHSIIEFTSKWIYVVRDNIEPYMRNEDFISGVYSKIEFTSKWMCIARNNIADCMINADKLWGVHSTIELNSEWIYVVRDNIEDNMINEDFYKEYIQQSSSLRNECMQFVTALKTKWAMKHLQQMWSSNWVRFEVNACSTRQNWRLHEKCRYIIKILVNNQVAFEMNVYSPW